MANLPTGGVPKVESIVYTVNGVDTAVTNIGTLTASNQYAYTPGQYKSLGMMYKVTVDGVNYFGYSVLTDLSNNAPWDVKFSASDIKYPNPSYPIKYFSFEDRNNDSKTGIKLLDGDGNVLFFDVGGTDFVAAEYQRQKCNVHTVLIPTNVLDLSKYLP